MMGFGGATRDLPATALRAAPCRTCLEIRRLHLAMAGWALLAICPAKLTTCVRLHPPPRLPPKYVNSIRPVAPISLATSRCKRNLKRPRPSCNCTEGMISKQQHTPVTYL